MEVGRPYTAAELSQISGFSQTHVRRHLRELARKRHIVLWEERGPTGHRHNVYAKGPEDGVVPFHEQAGDVPTAELQRG